MEWDYSSPYPTSEGEAIPISSFLMLKLCPSPLLCHTGTSISNKESSVIAIKGNPYCTSAKFDKGSCKLANHYMYNASPTFVLLLFQVLVALCKTCQHSV